MKKRNEDSDLDEDGEEVNRLVDSDDEFDEFYDRTDKQKAGGTEADHKADIQSYESLKS